MGVVAARWIVLFGALASSLTGAAILVACDDAATTDPGLATPQGTVSSCDLTSDLGYCLDFGPQAPRGIADANCQGASDSVGYDGGIVGDDASCPTANRVGSCAATINGIQTTYRYYPPKFTLSGAQINCANLGGGVGGAFTAN